MQKKLVALMLGLCLIAGLIGGCASTPAATAQATPAPTEAAGTAQNAQATATAPVAEVQEPITISVYTWLSAEESWGAKSKGEIQCFQQLEKLTNVKVEWSIMSDTNSFDLMMSSGDTTDVIWYSWKPVVQLKYAKAGLIMDVYPLVQQKGANVMKLLNSNDKMRKQLVTPDGKMYLIPWVTDGAILNNSEGFAIRKDWLDKLGLPVPATSDELYTTLKAFRDKDANGNGTADEIITGYSDQLYKLMYGFGAADDFMLSEDGKTVVYGPTSENYKTALKWFAQLYKDGILDPDYLSRDSDIYNKKVLNNQVGVYCDNVSVISTFMKNATANGTAITFEPMAYLKYNGKSMSYNSTSKRVAQQYGSCVSAKTKYADRIVQWLDYMYSDEGSTLMNWGIEGTSYTNNNGTLAYTDAVTKDATYDANTARSKFAEPTWCGPQSADAEMAMLDDLGKSFRTTWADVDNSLAMEPYMFFTEEQQSVVDTNQTNLKTEQNTWRDQFITGQKSIDTEWDAYVTALKGLGLEDLTKAYQGALDTFVAEK